MIAHVQDISDYIYAGTRAYIDWVIALGKKACKNYYSWVAYAATFGMTLVAIGVFASAWNAAVVAYEEFNESLPALKDYFGSFTRPGYQIVNARLSV